MSAEEERELAEIKKDLSSMNAQDFYVKHILKSKNWYFSTFQKFSGTDLVDKIDEFREIVSKHFKVNFYSVKMVGSAKVGYSLSPLKGFCKFHDETSGKDPSDIDVAIVSDKLYHYYWDKLRIEYYQNEYFKETDSFKDAAKSLFKGYLNDEDLRKVDSIRSEWNNIVGPINKELQARLFIQHPITYRLYRDWDDLQQYQINGIIMTKHKLSNEE